MKYILITTRFQKQLKTLRRYLNEQDVVADVKRFMLKGLSSPSAIIHVIADYVNHTEEHPTLTAYAVEEE
jgi:hypothetical protein